MSTEISSLPNNRAGTSADNSGDAQASSWTAAEVTKESLSDVGQRAKEIASSAVRTAGDLASSYGTKVKEASLSAKDKLGDFAATTGKKTVEELTELIRQKPIPALLVAFGIGYLFAKVGRKLNHGN